MPDTKSYGCVAPFSDEQIKVMSDPEILQLFMAKNEWVEEGDDRTYEVIFANPSFVKFTNRFLATITADRKRIEELEKQAEISDDLAKGVMTLAEVYEQLEDAKRRIGELEKSNKAWHDSPTKYHRCRQGHILPYPAFLCSMCHPNDYKPGEQDFNPRKLITKQAATIERLRGAGDYLVEQLVRGSRGTTHYENCEEDHPRCMAIKKWKATKEES